MNVKPKYLYAATYAGALFVLTPAAHANNCVRIADNDLRLACYDELFREKSSKGSGLVQSDSVVSQRKVLVSPEKPAKPSYEISRMIEDWDLSPDIDRASFGLRTYKPVYILLGTHTNRINTAPHSDNPNNTVNTPLTGLSANEAQFQLSFKTKIWGNIFGDNGNLWVGYTQSSRWQIYSGQISRPFRETNYEPEAMLLFRTPYSIGNWNLRMSGIGINHQSNGRANPLSRSWNRVIGDFGIENGDLSIQVRPWIRIREEAADDNNPGIENYLGRGEVIVAQRFGEHVVSLRGRHSLRTGENSRGSLKLDWAIPLSGNLRAHLSAFSGYGESLIDYNHRQTMFGVGVSLVEW